jgi:hypothetical protein
VPDQSGRPFFRHTGLFMAHRYLFVDGNYLDRAYTDLLTEFMGNPGDLDLAKLVSVPIGREPDRVYYYNSLDDERRPGEAEDAFKVRVEADMTRFDAIAAIPRFHVRLGSVSGRTLKRRRQKQVDVQLAVDALTHAFNKNMQTAVFIAGDLDFKPLVDSLVSLGVFVEVIYERTSAARELYRAADFSTALNHVAAWNWSTRAYIKGNSLPIHGLGQPETIAENNGTDVIAVGNMNGAHAKAARETGGGRYIVWVAAASGREQFSCIHERFETIETFIRSQYGLGVEWARGRELLPGNKQPPWGE